MTIPSDERTSKIAHYTLIAESMNAGITSVPEFPWPTIIAATALTLGVVALKRKQRKAA